MKKRIFKVEAVYEFEVDMSDFDPKCVDMDGLAKDLTKREVATLTPEDFEYKVKEIKVYYE